MPRGDRTGPMGMGPMSGRAAGFCAGYTMPGFMNPLSGSMGFGFYMGRGRGPGMGRGFGWSWRVIPGSAPFAPVDYPVPFSADQEMDILKNQAKAWHDQLEAIQKRISELEDNSVKAAKE